MVLCRDSGAAGLLHCLFLILFSNIVLTILRIKQIFECVKSFVLMASCLMFNVWLRQYSLDTYVLFPYMSQHPLKFGFSHVTSSSHWTERSDVSFVWAKTVKNV